MDGPGAYPLREVSGTSSCCDELRSGWLTERGPFWVAVDTLAQRISDPLKGSGFARAGPFYTVVDSGTMSANYPRGDTTLFTSILPRVLPRSPPIAFRRGDTLVVKSVGGRSTHGYDEIRIYVRVPPVKTGMLP
jgi:hypothetical protein